MKIRSYAPGPPGHGAVRHAQDLAVRLVEAGHVLTDTCPDVTHVQFTDALFGPDIASAAAAFSTWRAGIDGPVVVTLHDLPSGKDARAVRRRAGYRTVMRQCDLVVVSSEHERRLARAVTVIPVAPVVVIPLPLPRLTAPDPAAPAWAEGPTLGVLGFVYPGKGHALALELAATRDLQVVALGAVSEGHRDLRRQLGPRLHVTGPLTDAELHRAVREITVPLSYNPAVSASASLLTWIAAGRRPLVDDGPFASEIAERWPRSLIRLDAAALDQALADPASTWSDPPDDLDVMGAHVAAFESA